MSTIDQMPTRYEPGTPIDQEGIPLCVPEIRGNEWKYIKECLDTNWVSSVGPFVDRFEQEMAAYTHTEYAVAAVNGTAALHIALLVAGVQPEDEVLVSTLTFIAPANAIHYVGAYPVFIDAEPKYWQMDPQKVVDFLDNGCLWHHGELRNKVTGRRVRAILPVHILGHPVDMDPIIEIARKYNLVVIEDATESLGAKYKDQMVGKVGDIACFSFNGNKIITTGGGGMITTDNQTWAERAKFLTTQAKADPLEYIHEEIGYNYRLTNVLAALGVAQMEQLDTYIATKREIADTYDRAWGDIPGITAQPEAAWAFSIKWLYTVLIDEAQYGMNSRALLRKLAQVKIQTRPLWQPMHQSKAHADGYVPYGCDVAEQLNRQALSLPCSTGLTEREQQRVISILLSKSSERIF